MNKKKYGIYAADCLLAVLIGVVVGAVDTVFGRGLLWISDFRSVHIRYLLPFLPLAGIVIVWLYRTFDEKSLKGMSLVFDVGQYKEEKLPLPLIPLVVAGTWLTHLFGGSAGREGVAVQIGAVVSHETGRRLGLVQDDRILLITGMAAGFGGLFQTPLAAVFFAMEVLTAGEMRYDALLPSLIASYTASFTSHWLGLEKFAVTIAEPLNMQNGKTAAAVVLLGVIFGVTGRIFSVLLQKSKSFMAEHMKNPYMRIGVMGIVLALLLRIAGNGRYSGLGTNLISLSLGAADGQIFAWDFLLKILFTVLTLAIGFQGGEVTPLFSVGASLGVILGSAVGIPPVTAAALGYAAVFGGATNTLIAPVLIGLEVFGSANAIPFVLVCLLAYVVNGDRSIYGGQLKATFKNRLDQP